MRSQKRDFIKDTFDRRQVNAELDYLHQRLNGIYFPLGEKVFKDYVMSVADDRIYCMRAGITLLLPVLKEEDDGWVVFVQDRSGGAGASNITISSPPTRNIQGSASISIATNYGKVALQWDFKENTFFDIS